MNEQLSRPATGQGGLVDDFSRTISYLRLSLTDRCNLRCLYCVTEDERLGVVTKLAHRELLSYEELLRVVRVAVAMGIVKLRLTGGEPLLRRDVMSFITRLASIDSLHDIRLTTNGVLLARYAEELLAAGIRKINISLDTLRPHRFTEITGQDCFDAVWRGIEKTLALGFAPVKLNMVVMRGINDDELLDFARLAHKTELQVRFIEFMPIGASSHWSRDAFMDADEIMARIEERFGPLIPMDRDKADGPARLFKFGGQAVGTLGFISPISHHFCARCNRLRLTAEGRLRSCLLDDAEVDLKQVIRGGGSDSAVREALLTAIRNKPRGHQPLERLRGGGCHGRMSRIGG